MRRKYRARCRPEHPIPPLEAIGDTRWYDPLLYFGEGWRVNRRGNLQKQVETSCDTKPQEQAGSGV